MRVEIAGLYHKLDSTFIYVTHDQTEALTLGTRIVVMKDGEIQQVDTPQRLFHYPANQFVAGFIGTPPMNFLEGVVRFKESRVFIETEDGEIDIIGQKADRLLKRDVIGKTVVVGIRPEHISLVKDQDMPIHKEGVVDVYEMLGSEAIVYINQKGTDRKLIAKIDGETEIHPTDQVKVSFDLTKIHIFDKVTGETITN